MSDTIKVLLADDHPLVLDGIIARIEAEDDIRVLGKACNGLELLKLIPLEKPDVVLMDLNMPVMNGLEATKEIKQNCPEVRVLILSMHANREYIMQLMHAGASGYVLKDVASDELLQAIRTVAMGDTHFSAGAADLIFNKPDKSQNQGPLTKREEMVLKQLADGQNNRQIAKQLDISIRTVEKHRQNIKTKLDIHTSSGLIRYAVEHDLAQLG